MVWHADDVWNIEGGKKQMALQTPQRHEKAGWPREELSCLLVGDGAVGKTSMIISYIFNGYKSEYRQTTFDVFTGLVYVNGVQTRLKLIDTAGQDEFGHLRSLCYAHVDVFMLCFSLINPVSLDNITSKWIPQIRAQNPSSPIILVGTQSDLCHDADILVHLARRRAKPVAPGQAKRLARRIRAYGYMECSALTQHRLKDVFDCAIFAAIKHKHNAAKTKTLGLVKCLKTFGEFEWRRIFK
ncbi:rho-related GTP-binding protein RhoV-like isoform X2 [Hippocampus zosterae]|uniref:rho-related GTP-binding protein RhoV-like isoform X2 n=1 Tax=Hippocampus zosterae TaxID=109293 RepID=UPI00223C9C8B|nr:rho-related GTP-binding protein RhoV-like isoform X2 [Hippocampus zosterae]XP_051941975.1 rho-related GTP-binding protein RhoV-like isoform X2 [Hippocampus zosterae]